MSEAFIRAVRRRLHPDQNIPSPPRPTQSVRRGGAPSGAGLPPSQWKEQDNSQSRTLSQSQSRSDAPSYAQKRRVNKEFTDGDDGGSTEKTNDVGPKRRRTKTTGSASTTSERGSRYRPHPSKAVLDRYQRSLRHRLFLIERHTETEESIATFAVMGANGNVYRCKVCTEPTCDCPDFTKRARGPMHGPCKHLIFVFVRVLKVVRDDPVWWQTRLLPEEVTRILGTSPSAHVAGDDCMAEDAVRQMYRAMHRGDSSNACSDDSSDAFARKPVEGDCSICFENMADANETRPEDVTTFCESCGSNFHKTCVQNWARARERLTCPLCRGDMSKDAAPLQRPAAYANLAAFSSQHTRQMTLAELYADTHQYIRRRERAPRAA